MAVLCNVQFGEMFDFIDFFMNDRAGDSDTMLDKTCIFSTRSFNKSHGLLNQFFCINYIFYKIKRYLKYMIYQTMILILDNHFL